MKYFILLSLSLICGIALGRAAEIYEAKFIVTSADHPRFEVEGTAAALEDM